MSAERNLSATLEPLQCISVVELKHKLDSEQSPVLLDLSQVQTYTRGHIDGALHLPVQKIVRPEGYAAGLAPRASQLQALASAYGLFSKQPIVVYDDEGGGWAGRAIWILDILGLNNLAYLDGGLRAWMHAGLPLTSVIAAPKPLSVPEPLNFNSWATIDHAALSAALESDTLFILDGRSLAEYQGLRRFAKRSGHIPSAVHYEWTQVLASQASFQLRPLHEVMSDWYALGYQDGQTIVVYCQTHHRSGLLYLAARALGLPVRAYAGSWSEWGNLEDAPIATYKP